MSLSDSHQFCESLNLQNWLSASRRIFLVLSVLCLFQSKLNVALGYAGTCIDLAPFTQVSSSNHPELCCHRQQCRHTRLRPTDWIPFGSIVALTAHADQKQPCHSPSWHWRTWRPCAQVGGSHSGEAARCCHRVCAPLPACQALAKTRLVHSC